jgi:dTDP-4-amino-4,6-dideoxygalactose transaminase
MSNINAAIDLAQLKKLDRFVTRRRIVCRRYDVAFRGFEDIIPFDVDYDSITPFAYVIRVPERRDALINFLQQGDITTGVHYIANHTQPFFKKFDQHELPRTSQLWQEILTLPLYSEITDAEVERVIDAVTEFAKSRIYSFKP